MRDFTRLAVFGLANKLPFGDLAVRHDPCDHTCTTAVSLRAGRCLACALAAASRALEVTCTDGAPGMVAAAAARGRDLPNFW